MAEANRAFVNQRLYFCRLHLDWFEQQLAQQVLARSVLEQSLGQSCLYHLVMAYRAYLAEIAHSVGLTETQLHNATELQRLLQQRDIRCGEADELMNLENVQSWLSELLLRYANAKTDSVLTEPTAVSSASPIPVKSVDTQHSVTVDIDTAKGLFYSLKQLIETQRAQLEQW